jgi:DNA-binding transcriptional LysR family regulator
MRSLTRRRSPPKDVLCGETVRPHLHFARRKKARLAAVNRATLHGLKPGFDAFAHPHGDGVFALLHGFHLEGPAPCALKVKEVMSTNDVATLQAAVKSGLGIALVSPIGLAAEIAAGTIERLLPGYQGPTEAFWAVTRSAWPPAVELFLDYVRDIFARMETYCRDITGEKAFTEGLRRGPVSPCRARAWRARYRARRRRTAPRVDRTDTLSPF